ncbi:hypothetical protein [Mycoplasmopsis columboralis]|uniref:Uncharacterized protein n=1 Tax=Mycoplasmopsis columboralis TaxID=171282 RepID=A0A449B6K1_9BACT|nr:hypothetical protein [Mycoplasmopsis columboralis]VEU76138.1 Uncharacterised protein [Mycoplasmopsis columboralis]
MDNYDSKINTLRSSQLAGMWFIFLNAFSLFIAILFTSILYSTVWTPSGAYTMFIFTTVFWIFWFLSLVISTFFVVFKSFNLYVKLQFWNKYEKLNINEHNLYIQKILTIVAIGLIPLCGVGILLLFGVAILLWINSMSIKKEIQLNQNN